MGLLNKIFKGAKKVAKNPVAQTVVIGYAKKQSADVRKVAKVVEPILEVRAAVKASGSNDVMRDTIYAVAQSQILQGVSMNENQIAPIATVAPMPAGNTTSSFKMSAWMLVIIPFVPPFLGLIQKYVITLPPESTPAVIGGLFLTVAQYVWTRYKATDGARQASATVAAAQAMAATPAVPQTVNALHDVNLGGSPQVTTQVGSTPRPANAIPEAVEWRETMPDFPSPPIDLSPSTQSDDFARDLQAQAVIEQERENGTD